jgi:hypothetical protein
VAAASCGRASTRAMLVSREKRRFFENIVLKRRVVEWSYKVIKNCWCSVLREIRCRFLLEESVDDIEQ